MLIQSNILRFHTSIKHLQMYTK